MILALFGVSPSLAQRTVVQDAGGGRKIELHYSAAGKVTETDTIGADGKLLEKNVLEYPPGALIAQTVSTAYWPNGQIQKTTRNTYDNNSNFTGEFVQQFDESGKQIGGHQLTHDPPTNVYTCADWNTTAQRYEPRECPAGEESPGTPETVKKFTADEVRHQLSRAREGAEHPPKRMPTSPPSPQTTPGTNVKEVGIVLPAHMHSGERVSGSVVENPGDYENMPEVMVTRVALPFASAGTESVLLGWRMEITGAPPQSADGPIVFTTPRPNSEVTFILRPTDAGGTPIAKAIKLPVERAKSNPATSYLAAAVCVKGQLCAVRGTFTGDSSKTFAAFEERPAKIVAETTGAAYMAIPDATEPGSRPLVIAEGAKAIAFPTVVAKFSIPPNRRDLPKGETLLMYPTIEGPEELPDEEWRPGTFPPSNLEEARKLIRGFKPAGKGDEHERREAEEKREKGKSGRDKDAVRDGHEENEGGEILLVVKNLTPDTANFRESKNGTYVFHLNAAAFKMGEFKYKFFVEQTKTGNFGVQAYVIPFLAPIAGQEFAVSEPAAK